MRTPDGRWFSKALHTLYQSVKYKLNCVISSFKGKTKKARRMTGGRQGTVSHLEYGSLICDIFMLAVFVHLPESLQHFTKNNMLHSGFPNIGKWDLL